MDIHSLQNQIKFSNRQNLLNLFQTTMIYRNDIPLGEYVVSIDDEMRADILMRNIYNIDYSLLDSYLKDIDVLLFINNIDNPLSIKSGMVINYPLSIDDFSNYRYSTNETSENNDILRKLAIPNYIDKTTKVDSNRQDYIENNYSLSPVLMSIPREPVAIKNGMFSIGGL